MEALLFVSTTHKVIYWVFPGSSVRSCGPSRADAESSRCVRSERLSWGADRSSCSSSRRRRRYWMNCGRPTEKPKSRERHRERWGSSRGTWSSWTSSGVRWKQQSSRGDGSRNWERRRPHSRSVLFLCSAWTLIRFMHYQHFSLLEFKTEVLTLFSPSLASDATVAVSSGSSRSWSGCSSSASSSRSSGISKPGANSWIGVYGWKWSAWPESSGTSSSWTWTSCSSWSDRKLMRNKELLRGR